MVPNPLALFLRPEPFFHIRSWPETGQDYSCHLDLNWIKTSRAPICFATTTSSPSTLSGLHSVRTSCSCDVAHHRFLGRPYFLFVDGVIQTLCRFLPLLGGRCRTTSFQAPALLCRIRAQARERGCDFGFYLPLRYCARQIACLSAPSLYGLPRSKWTPLLFPFPISQWTRQYPIYPASSCSQLFQTRSEAYRRLSSTRHARRFRTCQEPEGPGFQSSLPRRLNLKTAGLQKGTATELSVSHGIIRTNGAFGQSWHH